MLSKRKIKIPYQAKKTLPEKKKIGVYYSRLEKLLILKSLVANTMGQVMMTVAPFWWTENSTLLRKKWKMFPGTKIFIM